MLKTIRIWAIAENERESDLEVFVLIKEQDLICDL